MDDALAKGATALTGGKKAELQAPYDKGYFFTPTVLSDCTIDMKVGSCSPAYPAVSMARTSEKMLSDKLGSQQNGMGILCNRP